MHIGNDFLVFKYPLNKKILKILNIFIEINVNVCLLCPHHVMTSKILQARRANCQYNVCYALGFYVSTGFLFSHFD